MNILILAAMDKEINLLINLLESFEDSIVDEIRVYSGTFHSHKLNIAKCGIGKVNSAINTYRLILNLKPDLIINSGVAGGAGSPVGSVVLADNVAYHDVWCGPGTKYCQAEGVPLFMKPSLQLFREEFLESDASFIKGLICSGDKFITTPEEIKEIRSHFPEVVAVDMESASISQTCIISDIPFIIIRVVSDTPGEGENISQYENFWNEAPQKTFSLIGKLIENIRQ